MTRASFATRALASGAVLSIVALVFSQNRPTAAEDPKPKAAAPEKENAAPGGMCPVMSGKAGPQRHTVAGALSNRDWWPNQLNLQILHQNSAKSDPMGADFNYADEFKKLDLEAVKKDIDTMLAT